MILRTSAGEASNSALFVSAKALNALGNVSVICASYYASNEGRRHLMHLSNLENKRFSFFTNDWRNIQ